MVSDFMPFIRKFRNDKVNLYATQAVFYLIISAVPFLMFLLSLVKYVLPLSEADLLETFKSNVPYSLQYWINSILSIVYTESTISVTSIAAVTTLWAASKSVFSLSQGLSVVYDSKSKKNYVVSRLLSMVYTLVFIIVLIVTMMIVVFSKPLINIIQSYVPSNLHWLVTVLNMSDFFPFLLIIVTFAGMYGLLSRSNLKFKDHLPGAILSALGWLLFSWIYAVYINNYSKFSVTYGSLANIVIMMLWLKICMNIFLLGAEFNIFLHSYNPRKKVEAN